jgi:hypothetical protein
MSEEQNIANQQQPEDLSPKPEMAEEKTSQHFPEDSHEPQPQTTNVELQTTDMEVRHHLRVTKDRRNLLDGLREKATGLIEFYKKKYHLE